MKYPFFNVIYSFRKIKNYIKVCGAIVIVSDLIQFLVESSANLFV